MRDAEDKSARRVNLIAGQGREEQRRSNAEEIAEVRGACESELGESLGFTRFWRAMGSDTSRVSTFDDLAAAYDTCRPAYPPEVIADVLELAHVARGATIMEIGCGTGQATRALAQVGLRIDAVELNPRMAALAAANLSAYPDTKVHSAAFEGWSGEATYDAVVAFTSFHLIDPALGYPAAERVLRRGGHLVLVGTLRVVPAQDSFGHRAAPIFASVAPGMAEAAALDPRLVSRVANAHSEDIGELWSALMGVSRFQTVPVFGPCVLRQRLWTARYTADSYVDLLKTYSTCNMLPHAERAWLLEEIRTLIQEEFGGIVEITFLNIVAASSLQIAE